MNIHHVFGAFVHFHLANRFGERQRFDVADGAADFDNRHVGVVFGGVGTNAIFDFVGDMRDDLHGVAQIIAAPLALDDSAINHARRHIGELAQILINETFVVAQIQIGFGAIFGDENLAVLVRVHGAGVHVEIRVDFLNGDFEAARFEEGAQARRCDAFADGRNHAASYKYIFSHANHSLREGRGRPIDFTKSRARL